MLPALVPLCMTLLSSSMAAPEAGENFRLQIDHSTIDVEIHPGKIGVGTEQIRDWITWAAKSVFAYYGRYPVPHLLLQIEPFHGPGVHSGHTFGEEEGGRIRIGVGDQATVAELRDDWMITHEMVHLALPNVPEQHHWMEEGIATYVEPIARLQAGYLTESQVWGDVVRDMWQGLPQSGDQGLDHTHTWGRTYWGGALFCLLADIEIHKRTGNRKGLEDALRAVLNGGGNIARNWPLERVLRVGDEAVGVPVLEDLYQKMKDKPANVGLDQLWRDLGISRADGVTTFNNQAPLASTRRAINAGPTTP